MARKNLKPGDVGPGIDTSRGMCLICSGVVRSKLSNRGQSEGIGESLETLHQLAKLFQVSDTIHQETDFDCMPAPVLCSSCHELVINAVELQENVARMESQLQREIRKIKGEMMHSYQIDSGPEAGDGFEEIRRIRKSYAQCWTPCTILLGDVDRDDRLIQKWKISSTTQTSLLPFAEIENEEQVIKVEVENALDGDYLDFEDVVPFGGEEKRPGVTLTDSVAGPNQSDWNSKSSRQSLVPDSFGLCKEIYNSHVDEEDERQVIRTVILAASPRNITDSTDMNANDDSPGSGRKQWETRNSTVASTRRTPRKTKHLTREVGPISLNTVDSVSAAERPRKTGKEIRKKPAVLQNPHVCEVCGKVYKSRTTLKQHHRTHFNDRPFQCEVCGKSFYRPATLAMHKYSHLDVSTFPCYICGNMYKSPTSVSNHVLNVHGKKLPPRHRTWLEKNQERVNSNFDYQSDSDPDYCPDPTDDGIPTTKLRIFPSELSDSHSNTKKTKKEDRKCPVCERIISVQANFNRHVELHNGEKDFPCQQCPVRYPSVPQLILHINRKHKMEHHCDICQRNFTLKSFINHKRKVHGHVPKPKIFNCDLCSKGFLVRGRYDLHMKKHANPDEVISAAIQATVDDAKNLISFVCYACQKTFTKESCLSNNENENELQILCEHENCACKATFTDFRQFMDHHKKVCRFSYFSNLPSSKSARSHPCKECSEILPNKWLWFKHMECSHPGAPKTTCDNKIVYRRFPCRVCGKRFKTLSYLRLHENTHSNTRSFLCEVCGKGFNTVTNLRAHRRRLAHYQTSKLSCHQCGKSFISEQNLENHICGTHVKFKETRPPQITKLCEECGQVCETDDLLNAHMHDLHPETRSGDHNQEIDTDDLSDKIITEDNDLEASNNHSEIASPNPVEFLNSLTELGESDNRSVGSDSNNNDSIAAETPAIDYSESEVEFDCDITPLNLDSYDTVVESVATTPMVQTVSTKPNRLAHKDTNVKDKNGRKCPICKLVLTKRVNFDQHVELHNGQQDFPCKECPARYGSVPQLINHTKRRHNITGFKSHCRICGRSFPKESFRSHQRDAHGVANIETTFDHDNNLISFECQACNETFQKESYVINGDQIQVPCQHGNCSCKATFSDFRQFMDHHKKICTLLYWINRPATKSNWISRPTLQSTSNRKRASFKCQFCDKTFGRQDILDAHVLIDHNEEKTLQESQAGNPTINAKGKTVDNFDIHPGNSGGQHVCEICGKCFTIGSCLRDHWSTHTGERLFECEVCGKCFRTSSNLKEHSYIHKDATFPCHLCNKLFKTRKNVKNHVYSTHEKRRPPRNIKKEPEDEDVGTYVNSDSTAGHPHVCQVCGKYFKLENYLRDHLSTHTDHRAFQCEVCGKGFRTLRILREHSRIHVDAAAFPCYVCGKLFKTKHYVKNHVYSTHEKRRPPRNKKKVQTN